MSSILCGASTRLTNEYKIKDVKYITQINIFPVNYIIRITLLLLDKYYIQTFMFCGYGVETHSGQFLICF